MATDVVDTIFGTFAERGGDSYGENISQLDHALQCASLAQEDGAEDALVAAALLHDYGHFFEGRGEAAERDGVDARHEVYGARLLRRWFGPEVVGPIAMHVAAKRYLCAVEPGYEASLSPASVLSLTLQGGRLTEPQRRRFERSRFAAEAVRLRRWDDAGKIPDCRTPGLESFRPLVERLAGGKRERS